MGFQLPTTNWWVYRISEPSTVGCPWKLVPSQWVGLYQFIGLATSLEGIYYRFTTSLLSTSRTSQYTWVCSTYQCRWYFPLENGCFFHWHVSLLEGIEVPAGWWKNRGEVWDGPFFHIFPGRKWRANPGRNWLGVVCTCHRSDGTLYLQRKFPTKSAQSFGSEIYPSSHNHGSGKWWPWKMSLVSKTPRGPFSTKPWLLDKEYVFNPFTGKPPMPVVNL